MMTGPQRFHHNDISSGHLHFSHFSLSPRVCSRSLSLTPGDQRSLSPSDQRYLCRIVPRLIGGRLVSDIWRGGKPGALSSGNPGDCTDNPLSSMAGNYQAKFFPLENLNRLFFLSFSIRRRVVTLGRNAAL